MCANKQIDFLIKATGATGAGVATVDGIPADLWMRFVERAAEIMPERKGDAWAAVLSEVIANIGGGGNTHTLILTDIPLDAVKALEEVATDVGESADSLVAKLYMFAQGKSLHIVKMIDEQRQPAHLMMLYGIPKRHWEAWEQLAQIADETAESMFGRLLQLVEEGKAQVTKNDTANSTTSDGDRTRVRRTEQYTATND